jgi:hypothetical protein
MSFEPTIGQHIGCAYDLMSIRIGDFWRLPYFVPIVNQLFSDEAEHSEELQSNKRKLIPDNNV